MPIFTLSNPKLLKGQTRGYLSAVLHFAPADTSGVANVCPMATEGCKASCLNTAGHGGIFKPGATTNTVLEARKRRTAEWVNDRDVFEAKLSREIDALKRRAAREGLTLCVRPNGTSDLPGLALRLAQAHPDVQFYDYTKLPRPWARELPNYHLTFSKSETNAADTLEALRHSVNVAVVFDTKKGKPLPPFYLGRPVVDGDETDLRFLDGRAPDGKALIIGLRAKGRAKKDCSGFVVRAWTPGDRVESRERCLARWESMGLINPTCPSCAIVYESGELPFAPRHTASERCESGKHAHCSCDACF